MERFACDCDCFDQTCEKGGIRVHVVPELSDPVTALRRQAQLGPARHHQTPLKSEEPYFFGGFLVLVVVPFSIMVMRSRLVMSSDETRRHLTISMMANTMPD